MPLSREDRWIVASLLFLLLVSFALVAVNAATTRFTGICYFPPALTPLIFVALGAVVAGFRLRAHAPRKASVLIDLGFYALAMIASASLVTGIQFTPFPPIDAALARWDAALGYDTVGVLHRVAAHPALRFALNRVYDSTDVLLVLAPLPALWRDDRRVLRVYLFAIMYTFLAGSLFYYFFPSSGPASVYSSPDFLPVQRLTFMKFLQVHHFQTVTTIWGGMVAFPSFHVAWSVLLTYAAIPDRRLFRAMVIWNALAIATTVVLGWHYLVDAPAGILLAALGLWAAAATHARTS